MPVSLPTVMSPEFEAELRQQCLSALDRLPTPEDSLPGAERLTELLDRGAQLLELFVVVTATAEVVTELGLATFGDVGRRATEIQERVSAVTDLDVVQVLQTAHQHGLPRSEINDDEPLRVNLTRLVRLVHAVTASFPADAFYDLASGLALPQLGYRTRVACEALRSFVRRHDPQQREIVLVVGRHYQRGAIELDDVATLLGESRSDAIALLEEHGFGRTVETIRLPEEKRRECLAAIREDRLRRAGDPPPYSREVVRRSTIASERIEGVDARPWLGTEPDRDRGR